MSDDIGPPIEVIASAIVERREKEAALEAEVPSQMPAESNLARVAEEAAPKQKGSAEDAQERQNNAVGQDQQPKITKLKAGRERKPLHFDYKRPIPPSKAFTHATPFSHLRYDPDRYESAEDYLDAQQCKKVLLERMQGSESEEARQQREEAIERAAGKIRFAPILERAPRECSRCREPIPGDKPRAHIVRVNQPNVGIEVSSIERTETLCENCCGKAPKPSQPEPADEGWMELLSPTEGRVRQLQQQGFNQEQIGKRLGKDQSTISRILKKIEGKQKEWRRQQYKKTGGAA